MTSILMFNRFGPPVIPKDFVPHHKFTAPLDVGNKITEETPPEVPPPDDNNLKLMIDGMATLEIGRASCRERV